MIYTTPNYYKKFSCVADRCEATCCAGWQIVIDDDSIEKYKNIKGDIGKRLEESIDWQENVFCQDDMRRCAFLNNANLCDLYTSLGEDGFCETCRRYPRHIEEFENVREITLSVSCPEVARILLNETEPVSFASHEDDEEEEFEEFDIFMFSYLQDTREEIIKILQDRSMSMGLRTGIVWKIAGDIQKAIDEGTIFTDANVFEKYSGDTISEDEILLHLSEQYDFSYKMFSYLYELELLDESWDHWLRETENIIFACDKARYEQIHNDFSAWLLDNMPDWEIWCEQLLVYFLYTYYCGAVYDGEVFAKVKLSIISVLYIYEMWAARWIINEGEFDIEDAKVIVYKYSRELEHSDLNLDMLEELLGS